MSAAAPLGRIQIARCAGCHEVIIRYRRVVDDEWSSWWHVHGPNAGRSDHTMDAPPTDREADDNVR